MGIISCGTTLIDQGLYQGLSSVDWDTTPKTATFTGVAGNGYFCNTSSGPFTLNLPAGSVGDIIAVSDYASTFNVAEIPAVYSNPESTLGTADLTVTGVNNFSAPSGTVRAQDLFSAVDVGSFTSSDYGVLWETGGTGEGFAASLEAGGQLWVAAYDGDPWANSAMAYLKVDVSSYYNTPGTFYTTIDVSSKQFNLYFQPGGPTGGNQAISLGTSTAGTTTSWAGTNNGALGQQNPSMVNFGFTNYNQPFTGDAQELRWYYNTAEPSPFQSITTPAVPATPLTISPNGTDKINGTNDDYTATTKGVSLVLLYVDSTRGWKVIGGGEIDASGSSFITATGGTITTDGDFKIHTFTSPGTFSVTDGGDVSELLIVSGGGGSGYDAAGGGGAGGLKTQSSITVSDSTPYTITVGSGGAKSTANPGAGSNGSNSSGLGYSSTGGGGGGSKNSAGLLGGSGGGSGHGGSPSGAGTPGEGNPGGNSNPISGGGGGGASAAGEDGLSTPQYKGGNGGDGSASSITGSPVTYAGGGAGGNWCGSPTGGDGGAGGGGYGGGVSSFNGPACGTANTGGGGGSNGNLGSNPGSNGNGGSGIVIIRYRYQ
jgi:hypothetical protein